MILKGYLGLVNCVGYDVSGRWIVSVFLDKFVKIWNV